MRRSILAAISFLTIYSLANLPAALAQAPDEATPTATLTETVAAASDPTSTATATPTATATATDTATPSPSASEGPGGTATLTPTATHTPTSTLTPTPTRTPLWPTDTPTPTPTWSPTPTCADGWEPNQQPGSGAVLVINQSLGGLSLYPTGDVDFFQLWGKGGRYYQVTTASGEGLDTRIQVFDPIGNLIAENDDYEPGNPASQVRFQAPGEGWFAVKIDSRVPADWGCRQYSVSAVDVSPPTPTPTRTPGPPPPSPTSTPQPTSVPGEVMYDEYEPNYDFNTAANMGVGQTLNLNFNPYPAGSNQVDNDFFRLYTKLGERLRVETTGLAEGVDTNLILYRDNGVVIAGNDDCLPGERYSCIEWEPDYTGLAYVLVGPVGTIPAATSSGARAYSLVVEDIAGLTPTPGVGGWGTATPVYGQSLPPGPRGGAGAGWPVTPLAATTSPAWPTSAVASTPISATTPTPAASVRVRPLDLAPPSPTSQPMQPVTVDLSVYYDENNNRAPDASEGVAGLSVRVLNAGTNELLGQAFTDGYGHTRLTVAAPGEVRVSVPYLGYNQALRSPGKSHPEGTGLTIRLVPLRLPSLIP
jgi:hypothetical protein